MSYYSNIGYDPALWEIKASLAIDFSGSKMCCKASMWQCWGVPPPLCDYVDQPCPQKAREDVSPPINKRQDKSSPVIK